MARQGESRRRGATSMAALFPTLVAAFRREAWDDARRILKANPSLIDPEIGADLGRAIAAKPQPALVAATPVTTKLVAATPVSTKPSVRRIRVTSTPELLSESERSFIAWMEANAVDVSEEEYRSLFARCLEVGVDAAFWEAGKTAAASEVQRMRAAAESTHLLDDAIGELGEDRIPPALDDWRRMASHPEFASAPLPLQKQILGELAQLLARQMEFGAAGNLADERVEVGERLVATNDQGSAALEADLVSLGNAYVDLFDVAGRLDALDKAVTSYRDAVAASREADQSIAMWSLGTALARRYEFSSAGCDLDEAIAVLEECLPATNNADVNNLAIALMHRYERSSVRCDLDRAIELLTSQLEWSRSAATLQNLATALFQRHRVCGALIDLNRGRRALREALARTPGGSPERPGQLSNLLRALTRATPSAAATREIRKTVNEIKALSPSVSPDGVVAAVRAWGEWAASAGEWKQAAVAFSRGLDIVDGLVGRESSAGLKEDWIRHTAGVAFDAAYAFARLDDGVAAALAFERGRAVLLREDLRRAHGDLVAAVEGLDALQRAADLSPLVLMAARQWGGFALIVRSDDRPRIISLPNLTEPAVARHVGRYLAAYNNRAASPHDWDEALLTTTRWLWRVAMGRLVSASLGPRAVVVPAGGLGILPLHAAWKPDEAVPARKRYVLDSLTLTYAPSIVSLLFARAGAAAVPADGLAGVADPSARGQAPLPAAVNEVAAAARHFSRSTVLRRSSATRDRVMAALRQHGVWHMACHGFAGVDIADAGLVLAGGEVLSTRDVSAMGPTIDHVRLAVLSACESAVADGSVPDEMVSLPTAMLRAGVAGVIGSLWSVPAGDSTAVLFARFYELWREERLEPADALRSAQRWLRDTTNGQKRARFPQLIAPGAGVAKADLGTWARARPYRAPYFWAPFVYVGA